MNDNNVVKGNFPKQPLPQMNQPPRAEIVEEIICKCGCKEFMPTFYMAIGSIGGAYQIKRDYAVLQNPSKVICSKCGESIDIGSKLRGYTNPKAEA